MIAWPRFVQAYREAGGPALNELTVNFYALLGDLKVYCAGVQARASVANGQLRDIALAECSINWPPMFRQRMSRRLCAITA